MKASCALVVYCTLFSEVIVVSSSWDNFRAAATLVEVDTISAFSSLHLDISLFSFSRDFFSAWMSFSYSTRILSMLLSPTSSLRTIWNSSKESKEASPVVPVSWKNSRRRVSEQVLQSENEQQTWILVLTWLKVCVCEHSWKLKGDTIINVFIETLETHAAHQKQI